MRAWLHQHDFSYKKPAVVPGKANLEAQKRWIEEYNELKARLPADEAICFVDGVHPTHNTKPVYGWIKKGERKEIPTNSGRQRLNLSGAIDIITKRVLIHQDITLNAHSTITFFQKIEKAYPEENLQNASRILSALLGKYFLRRKFMAQFDHEKLNVYQVAIEFVILVDEVIEYFPRGRAYIVDQLQRAAASIPINIAEGAGEYASNEKGRFY